MSRSPSLCGGCATPSEVSRLTSRLDEGTKAPCSRCGFGTYLVLGEAPRRCTVAEHEAAKADVEVFKALTTGHESWLGLFTGHCSACSSTISLALCRICREPAASGDQLPWGPAADETVAHFACVARTVTSKFVIVVGGGTAREFVRNDVSAGGGVS